MHVFSLNVVTKVSITGKKLRKFRFFGSFSIAETEEFDLNVGNDFEQFGINIPCSARYFLEFGEPVSLKLDSKGSLGGKRILEIQKV